MLGGGGRSVMGRPVGPGSRPVRRLPGPPPARTRSAAWPLAARAQQPERMRRIGVLTGGARTDPVFSLQSAALLQGLQQLGWIDGRNVQIDYRLGAGNADNIRKYSAELVTLAPDVILVAGTTAAGALLQVAGAVPVVFVNLPDPVGAGYVKSLATPPGSRISNMA
jgi:putative ABC transport system substrate-binding protein